jgi:hypothetical protein
MRSPRVDFIGKQMNSGACLTPAAMLAVVGFGGTTAEAPKVVRRASKGI